MREIVFQVALAFIIWSLTVELTGWALHSWLGDRWWRKLLGEPQPAPDLVESKQRR